MRALIQRVREARVSVGDRVTGAIGPGLLVLAAVAADDADADREWIARKIVALRIFDDAVGVMNRSVVDIGGAILAVSQFTLYASTKQGRPAVVVRRGAAGARPAASSTRFVERPRARAGQERCHRRIRRDDAGHAHQRRPGDDLARFAAAGIAVAAGRSSRICGRCHEALPRRSVFVAANSVPQEHPCPRSSRYRRAPAIIVVVQAVVPRPSMPSSPFARWRLSRSDRPGGPPRAWLRRVAFIIATLAVAAFLLRDAILGTPVDVIDAARGDLVQTVVASGRVTTPQRVSIGAVVTERIAHIPVHEGQHVKRGDLLIGLDDRDERAAIAQAAAAVAQADARIRQLREVALPAAQQSLAQAQANLVLATQHWERAQGLKVKGFVSQSALDDAKRNLDVARSQEDAARLQVESNRPTGSDVLVAQTALEQARATLAAAQAKLDQTILRAPQDGTLIARHVEPGDVVQPGKELMVLAPIGETQIVVQIDEKNLSQLKLGQKAVGSADAYPRERFAAELFYINPGIDALRGSVEVKLRVPAPPAYLRQDMTVSVDIDVARRTNVVVVPSGAVFDAAGAQPWVLAVEGRRAVRRPVTLGLQGEGRVEVTAGVAPGERLVAAANAGVLAGQRVRATAPTQRHPVNPLGLFEVIVAFRFMREGLTQTLLIVFGVALGAGVIIFMSALLAGLQSNIVRRTLNFQAPIQIRAPEQVARPLRDGQAESVAAQIQPRSQQLRSVDQWQKVRADVARMPDVIGATPVVSGPGFARRGEATKSVTITGIETETYFDVIALPEKIVAGRHDVGPLDIVIGIDLAKDLGTAVGDKLSLATATGATATLNVTGTFDFGNKGVNERNVYVALRTAQNLLDLAGGASSLEVKVRDPFDAESTRAADPRGPRSPGGQLDQHQCAVLLRDGGADSREHADPDVRGAHRRAGNRERAGSVGRPEVEGDRHPSRNGHCARASAARLPDPGRLHGALRIAVRVGACVGLPAPVARRREESGRHADVRRDHRAVAVRDRLPWRDARRHPRRRGPGPARGAPRSGRGHPWLRQLAPRPCASRACASRTASGRRSRPKCSTAST